MSDQKTVKVLYNYKLPCITNTATILNPKRKKNTHTELIMPKKIFGKC